MMRRVGNWKKMQAPAGLVATKVEPVHLRGIWVSQWRREGSRRASGAASFVSAGSSVRLIAKPVAHSRRIIPPDARFVANRPPQLAPTICLYRHHIADFIPYRLVFDYN